MALSALLPTALILGALVALPLLAHLSRQVPQERLAFGAMLLVQRLARRLRRRRRVKDPLLLLLRALAMLALVLAAAGLRFSYPGAAPEFGGSGRVVVLLDQSQSMSLSDGGSSLFERARADAARVITELPDGALVGVVTFGDGARRLTPSLTADRAGAAARLASIEPTGARSDLRAALHEARSLLAGEPGEVLLFSDEAGPRTVAAAEGELALLLDAGSAVIPRQVAADPPRNVAVVSAEYGDGIEGGQVAVVVANYGPAPLEVACEVTLPDGAAVPIFVDLPPEGEALERVTVPREASGGVGRVRCEDPDLPFDDARYFHLPRVGASRVLVVDGDPGHTPTRSEVYFLERALAPWGGARAGVRPDVVTPAGLGALDPEVHRVVFLANVSDPRPFANELVAFVRAGGAVVISGGDNVTADRYNAALGSILPAPLRRPRALAGATEPGVPLALPDLEHELFGPFARSGRALFGRVRANRVLTLDPYEDGPEVHTALRWEGGLPALVEREVGAGRVILWTGSFDAAWGNLPLQAVFMPMVQRLVVWLGAEAGGVVARLDASVGERVSIPLPDAAAEPDVIGPDGERVRSTREGSALVFTPERAGAYALAQPDAPPSAWIAVNVAPDESDVRVTRTLAEAEAALDPELFMRHVELAPKLLFFGLGLLVLQALLAARGTAS